MIPDAITAPRSDVELRVGALAHPGALHGAAAKGHGRRAPGPGTGCTVKRPELAAPAAGIGPTPEPDWAQDLGL